MLSNPGGMTLPVEAGVGAAAVQLGVGVRVEEQIAIIGGDIGHLASHEMKRWP